MAGMADTVISTAVLMEDSKADGAFAMGFETDSAEDSGNHRSLSATAPFSLAASIHTIRTTTRIITKAPIIHPPITEP